MAPRSFARWLLALVALFCVASTASAAVLGIDYGSEYVKVSIVAPGRTPISIVINEISKRKSTAAVAFTGGDRWLAEEAMNYNARFPDRVFTRLRDLLGKETAVDSFTRYLDKYKLPFKVTADAERATARIVTESGEAYLVEELVAMILQYAMKIGEGMGKGQIKVRRSRLSLPPARRARRAAAIGRSVGNARSNGHPSSTFFFRRRRVSSRSKARRDVRFRSRSNPPTHLSTPSVRRRNRNRTRTRNDRAQDAVIAIPPYFGQTHRYALYDAADIAGLNILAEVSDLSAAALQWGIDKEFTPEGTWTIVYDMGATSVGAALVRYSTFDGKEAGKKKTHGQFEIKAVAWDESCGGEDMDMVLVDHFAAEFDAAHKPSASALASPRAVSKLRKQVRKTKEILSANKEAPISVEGMHEDHDFRSSIKRAEFEKLAETAGIRACATAPLQTILERLPEHGVALKDVEAVEVIGGATRVPFIKKALSEALGGRALDVHLDADEAVAMGAGLFAANMSTTFRMRKFGAADAAPYGFEVDVHDPSKPGERKPLLPLHKRFPVRRIVSIPNATEDRAFTVYHNVSAGQRLPPGIVEPTVAEFAVAGVKEAMAKHDGVLGKINAHFAVDNSGILYMDKAEYQVEVFDMVEVEEPPPPPPPPPPKKKEDKKKKGKKAEKAAEAAEAEAEASDDSSEPEAEAAPAADEEAETKAGRRLLADETLLEDSDGDAEVPDAPLPGDDAAGPPAPPAEKKMRERRRVFRTPLKVTESKRAVAAMSPDAVKKSIGILKDLAKKDEAKRAQEAAKSNLEAYIYQIRERVEEDEGVRAVTDDAQREAFAAELAEAEDWLYMDGAESSASEFDAKKEGLQATGDEWIKRAKETVKRPAAVAKAREFVAAAKETLAGFAESKPWIPEEEKAAMEKDLDEFLAWLDEKEALQAEKKVTERPAFAAAEVASEVKPLDARLGKLKRRPAPPPPEEEKDANATDAEADANATDADAADADADADAADADADADADAAEKDAPEKAEGASTEEVDAESDAELRRR